MTRSRSIQLCLGLIATACTDTTLAPDARLVPSFAMDAGKHHTVVVNPNANGTATASTIQQGIDMVEPGGKVQVKPGTYAEALVINKGLTLEGIGDGSEPVIVAPPGAPTIAVQVATTAPVTIRTLTVQYGGLDGIRGDGLVDLTVERVTVTAVNPPLGANVLVSVFNNPPTTGRARLVVRESDLDGSTAFANSATPPFSQTFGIGTRGVVDAVIEGNTIRRAGGACINIQTELSGEVHADILNNDLDECYPLGRAGALTVGPRGTLPAPLDPFTATGTVNIVGNTIRNTLGSCLTTAGINYEAFAGRIEHNRILGVVQSCASATTRVLPAGIWVGSFRGATPASVTVRFNDIEGNAHAGLRIAPNITTPIDASCNWWGSASGPTATAWPSGTGDTIVVEAGAATPAFTPFAKAPNDDGCGSTWSAPVNLGPAINTDSSDMNPSLSPDELSLYFTTTRVGGQGAADIWVSHRTSPGAPWQAPVNLGAVINSPSGDGGPTLSTDGHRLFFFSNRPGGQGLNDVYVSYRADTHDDFAWGAPVNLGAQVNTAANEAGPEFVDAAVSGTASLLFNRGQTAVSTAPYDLYSVPLGADGLPTAAPTPIVELNTPQSDFGPELSDDGLELFFVSGRPGTLGGNDLWRTTRVTTVSAWAPAENLGAPVNTALNDRHPSLSGDGRTLIFASTRIGGFGSDDLWMTTRRVR